MKKNYLYIFATALVIGFSSCSDFLDRYPQEELSDGSFWKTPDDANKVVSNGRQAIFQKVFMTLQIKVGAVIMPMFVSAT